MKHDLAIKLPAGAIRVGWEWFQSETLIARVCDWHHYGKALYVGPELTPMAEDVTGKIIDWRMNSPAFHREYKRFPQAAARMQKGAPKMQRQFTIELRVDYKDPEKNTEMRKTLQHCARMMLATAKLLADGQEPQCVLFSDDFFVGSEEIPLLEDIMSAAVQSEAGQEDAVSQELMDALKESAADKKR